MNLLRKDSLRTTYCPENLKTFADGVLNADRLAEHVPIFFMRDLERRARDLSLNKTPSNSYRELFLRIWAARAYELEGHYFDAAICYNRGAKAAGGLGLFEYRKTMLEHCAECHLRTDRPERFENTAYAYLKIANCMDEELLPRLRKIRDAEIGFLCAGVCNPDMAVLKKILRNISLPTLDELMEDILNKKIKMKTPEQRELLMRQVLNSFFSLGSQSELEGSLGRITDTASKTVLNAFLGRHYENEYLPLEAGRAYQSAAMNSSCQFGSVTFDLYLRAAVNYFREESPAAALVPLRRIAPSVGTITPEFSEAFHTRIRAIGAETQNLYK